VSPPLDGRPAKNGEPQRWLRAALQCLDPNDPECLEWPFAMTGAGYGLLRWHGELRYAHQVACEYLNGPRPAGLEVAHTCGNRRCLNHARWDTHAGNVADMIRHGTSNRGSRHPGAVLAEREVKYSRWLAAHDTPLKDISVRYGVAPQTIGDAVSGRTWGWLPRKRLIPRRPVTT
jgi:HNH endonuclease